MNTEADAWLINPDGTVSQISLSASTQRGVYNSRHPVGRLFYETDLDWHWDRSTAYARAIELAKRKEYTLCNQFVAAHILTELLYQESRQ